MTLRNIDTLFLTDKVCVLGAAKTPAQKQMLDNLRGSPLSRLNHVKSGAWNARLPKNTDACAVIFDERWGRPRRIAALAAAGCRSVVWAAQQPLEDDVLRAARPHTMRFLGGRTAGVINTRNNVNMTSLVQQPRPGKVALISQSQSLTAAALDWALGRGIGFSWLACTGAEADIDAADLLDLAALDPRTRAVVLQLGDIKQPRKFMSAARAVAHVKPVLVLQTRTRWRGSPAGRDPARSAAFARAGLVECETLGGLFDGLAALELLPRVRQDRVMVLGNGAGVCALATDTLRRESLQAVEPSPETTEAITRVAPAVGRIDSAVDLEDSNVEQTVAAVRAAMSDSTADAVLLAHSPVVGHPHAPLVEALGQANLDARLMTVWLGLHTAHTARAASGRARLATFASVDEAARAIRYRRRYHENRQLLSATPPPDPSVNADVEAIRARLAKLAAGGVEWLSPEDASEILAAYDILDTVDSPTDIVPSIRVRIEAIDHPELGMALRITDEVLGEAPAYSFPPLDALLAHRMLDEANVKRPLATEKAVDALARVLVRLSKLVVELIEITRLDLQLAIGPQGHLKLLADTLCEITDQPKARRERLAMSPYPARMRHRVKLRHDQSYIVRAIRPSDEPMLLNLLESLSPEEIRLRFFSIIRHFSHDMAARMTQVDYDREVSLVASPADAPGQLAGTATIIADRDGQEAEFAVLVHRNHAGVGLGSHLLDCLLRQAHARGITTVFGDVLTENRPMLELARRLGFSIKHIPDDPSSVRAEIDVARYRSGGIALPDGTPESQ